MINFQLSQSELQQLTLLRIDLNRQFSEGRLQRPQYTELMNKIDAAWAYNLEAQSLKHATPEWTNHKAAAWQTIDDIDQLIASQAAPETVIEGDITTEITSAEPEPQPVIPKQVQQQPSIQIPPKKPAQPSAIDLLIEKVSGWSSLAAPFLLQNIGWFIGWFSFLSGSIFLISYTEGFTKSLAVFASLFSYTLLLLWGGYQLKRKNPKLTASSQFLFILSTLLMPITLAAATRMIAAEPSSGLTISVGIAAALVSLAVFFYLSKLVMGILQGKTPQYFSQWFLGLSSVQVVSPFLHNSSSIYPVITIHLMIIGCIAAAFQHYRHLWLGDIQKKQPIIAAFSAISLLYAGITSFIHVQYSLPNTVSMPSGYYGFLLVLVSAGLFYIDALIKAQWKGFAWINQTTFSSYGVLMLGLSVSLGGIFQVPTFAVATILTWVLTWRYQTWVPFYISTVLFSLGYFDLVLSHFDVSAYFILTLPLVLIFQTVSKHWMSRSQTISKHLYFTVGILLIGTGYYSQLDFDRSLFGLAHIGLITATIYIWLLSPVPWLEDIRTKVVQYFLPIHTALAILFIPNLFGLSLATHNALYLTLLSAAWIGIALKNHHRQQENPTKASCNSAALAFFAATFSLFISWQNPQLSHAVVLGLITLLLLFASFAMRWQLPLYIAMGAAGLAVLALKHIYFPDYRSSTGAGISLVGLSVLWAITKLDDTWLTSERGSQPIVDSLFGIPLTLPSRHSA
ncbi:MAG: hypothetical protein HOM11_01310 [Methylococcales bacterium]|nr:hypothetical protein [Methylococcales bacterium]MBT7443999.1 hypothetical protein [Methylococcales bacterium]